MKDSFRLSLNLSLVKTLSFLSSRRQERSLALAHCHGAQDFSCRRNDSYDLAWIERDYQYENA
ncbi:hypothetical protein [Thiolapillus sp.]|uniref:hypothetical protein n=1 Tax=Thiolapillus sp. TaxID=2017437 RepID=UPI003AF4B5F2